MRVRSRLRAELTLSQQVQENKAIHSNANRDRRAELKRQVFVSQPHVMPSRRNLERLKRIIRPQQMRRLVIHINAPVVIIRLRYDDERWLDGLDFNVHALRFEL